MFGQIRKKQPRQRIVLHQDNASSHTSRQTTAYLTGQNVELMGHPPYSPDLASNDFFLFPYVKNKLRGQRFSTPEEVVTTFKKPHFGGISIGVEKVLRKLVQTHAKVYDHLGEYFEKQ